jgi:hypothetical protein
MCGQVVKAYPMVAMKLVKESLENYRRKQLFPTPAKHQTH